MYHFLGQRSLVESPLCRCVEDIQTVEHISCDCPIVEEEVKRQLDEFSWKNLVYGHTDITVDLLNCSRNSELATICKKGFCHIVLLNLLNSFILNGNTITR